jgi:hypothetical protein
MMARYQWLADEFPKASNREFPDRQQGKLIAETGNELAGSRSGVWG